MTYASEVKSAANSAVVYANRRSGEGCIFYF